jgi:hypothetical protein
MGCIEATLDTLKRKERIHSCGGSRNEHEGGSDLN